MGNCSTMNLVLKQTGIERLAHSFLILLIIENIPWSDTSLILPSYTSFTLQ